MIHDLIKHSARQFQCRACQQEWTSKPRTACPGAPVYSRREYAPLKTKAELQALGYRTAEEDLPPVAGYYYSHGGGKYIPLYDPIYATPRLRRLKGIYIAQISWPLCYMPLLESFYELTEDRRGIVDAVYWQAHHEIANIAASTVAFSRAVLAQYSGYVFEFALPPTPLHMIYPLPGRQFQDEMILVCNLTTAYRRHIQKIVYL